MATSIKNMNRVLYNASFHLLEASKHLSNEELFREEAEFLANLAEDMSDIIQAEPEKVTDDTMSSILDEILSIGESK
jgi:hypothetical protein